MAVGGRGCARVAMTTAETRAKTNCNTCRGVWIAEQRERRPRVSSVGGGSA